MAHCCPKCKAHAPLLFRYCPECDFDMIDCQENGCKHKPATMGEKFDMENPNDE